MFSFVLLVKELCLFKYPLQGLTQLDFWQFLFYPYACWPLKCSFLCWYFFLTLFFSLTLWSNPVSSGPFKFFFLLFAMQISHQFSASDAQNFQMYLQNKSAEPLLELIALFRAFLYSKIMLGNKSVQADPITTDFVIYSTSISEWLKFYLKSLLPEDSL